MAARIQILMRLLIKDHFQTSHNAAFMFEP